MNCKLINALMFAAGAIIGSAVTWKVVKTKYERIAQEEIESVKEAFASGMADFKTPEDEDGDEESDDERPGTANVHKINWADYNDLGLDDEDYCECEEDEAERVVYETLANNYNNKKGGPEGMTENVVKPYVISPYDFGELDSYHQIELTYYADDVLEDEEGDIVTDRDNLIGADSLFTFGEYEDDSVFVRNEYLCTDFQILRDNRTYEEVRGIGPKQVDN